MAYRVLQLQARVNSTPSRVPTAIDTALEYYMPW